MWLLQVNQSDAKSLGFLPAGAIDSNRVQTLKEKAYGTLQFFLHSDQWKSAMFRGSYYFSGKGFQKAGLGLMLVLGQSWITEKRVGSKMATEAGDSKFAIR